MPRYAAIVPLTLLSIATFATFSAVGCRVQSEPAQNGAKAAPQAGAPGVAAVPGVPAASAASAALAAASSPSAHDRVAIAEDAVPVDAGLAALAETETLVALDVAASRAATVGVPLGAREVRPVVVALHGNFDRPEWACDIWTNVTKDIPFVICPRGTARTDAPGQDRWTYPGSSAAAREVDRALTAARARWGAYIDEGPMVYAGFSLGAILGVPIVAAEAARFPRVILVEGGHDGWTDRTAAAFAAGAADAGTIVPRVLFVCAQTGCMSESKAAKTILNRHGVEAEIVSAGNVGHRYDGPVADATRSRFAWVVEGMPGWPKAAFETN